MRPRSGSYAEIFIHYSRYYEIRLSLIIMSIRNRSTITATDRCAISDYDRAHFLTYARIIDALRYDQHWTIAATEILGLDITDDAAEAYCVWFFHVERALWLLSDGLAAIEDSKVAPQMIQ